MIKSHALNVDNEGNVRGSSQIHRDATSVRQLSEWGMRGFQGSFPRLTDRLRYEEQGERRIILSMIVLLCNFRATNIGINQIRTTFLPKLEKDAMENLHLMPGVGERVQQLVPPSVAAPPVAAPPVASPQAARWLNSDSSVSESSGVE